MPSKPEPRPQTTTRLAHRIAITAAFALAFVAMAPGASALEMQPKEFHASVTCQETGRIANGAAFALACAAMASVASDLEPRSKDFPGAVTCQETEGFVTCQVCARPDTKGDWPVGEDHENDGVVVWVAIGPNPATFKAGYTEEC